MNKHETIGLIGITEAQQEAKIALQGVRATMNLYNGSLHVQIEQRYVNLETIPIEAVYSFPLPLEASVCGFRVKVGEREIVAKLEDRDAAFEKYDEAIAEGKTAYLLDADTPNHFTCSVGNLAPGEDVTVILSYVQTLGIQEGTYRLSLPTLLSMVYTPSEVVKLMDPAELDRLYPPRSFDPLPYGLSLKAKINLRGGIQTIDCPSHAIKTTWEGDIAQISFSHETVAMDHDFILNVTPKMLPVNLAYCCPDPYVGGWIAFAQFLPEQMSNSTGPQNITFLLDCSGSMMGESIVQAKAALQLLLASLQPQDRFNIVAFGSSHKLFSPYLLEYNDENLSKARDWVKQREADMGGTEVLPAILQVLKFTRTDEQSIILLTDGDVGNTDHIIMGIKKTDRVTRIYTIGLGYNTDEELLHTLASKTGGAVEMAYPGESLGPIICRHLLRIRCAKPESIRLYWGNEEECLPHEDYVFILGESKWFMKHLNAKPEGQIQLCIGFEDKAELLLKSDPILEVSSEFSFLPQLYAKYMLQKGRATRRSHQKARSGKSKSLELSLKYGVLCPETSFILVDPLTKQKMSMRIGLRKVPLAMGYSLNNLNSRAGFIGDTDICNKLSSVPGFMRDQDICYSLSAPRVSNRSNMSLDSCTNTITLSEQIVLLQTAQGYWDDHSLLKELKVDRITFYALVRDIKRTHKLQKEHAKRIALSLICWCYLKYCDIKHTNVHLHMISKVEQWLSSNGIGFDDMLPCLQGILTNCTG